VALLNVILSATLGYIAQLPDKIATTVPTPKPTTRGKPQASAALMSDESPQVHEEAPSKALGIITHNLGVSDFLSEEASADRSDD
jgi:hypothetical protein